MYFVRFTVPKSTISYQMLVPDICAVEMTNEWLLPNGPYSEFKTFVSKQGKGVFDVTWRLNLGELNEINNPVKVEFKDEANLISIQCVSPAAP